MWAASQHLFWAAVLIFFFALVTLRYDRQQWWMVIAAISLCFLLADQGSVHLFKEQFHRLRPCHALEDVYMFRTHCGGAYGFVSSHAANACAIATFLILRYRRHAGAVTSAAIWLLLTCYSRIYLGKHFPGDVAGGALFGFLVGLSVYGIFRLFEQRTTKNKRQTE